MEDIDVLAIDDDRIVQKIVRRALEPQGFRVRTADDGEHGLATARAEPPDIILLDVEMPGMNGYQVCEQLVEDPTFKYIPIVFLSSHSSLQERLLGYEMGASDYIVKPFESDDLLARIRVLLKYAGEQRELQEQIEQAQRTAMEALSTTNELGQAMSFMESSLSYNTIEDAAMGLLQVTRNLALDCRLMVTLEDQTCWFPSEDQISPLEKELMSMSDRNQRFLDFGDSTLVNYPAASLLVTNMPLDNPERYGRIKDLLPLLLSGLSAKIYSLATQQALKEHADALNHSVGQIRGALYQLGRQMIDSRKSSTQTLQGMVHNLQDDLLRMGLKEDEEEYLIERIDNSAEEALDAMDSGAELAASFSFVHNNLKQVYTQQQRLTDAFEHILSQQQQVEQSAAGDIELF